MSQVTTRLFSLIKKCYEAAFWDDFDDDQLIGIHLPKEKEPSFISILGRDNDCRGFLIYRDYREAAYYFQRLRMKDTHPKESSVLNRSCTAIYFKDQEDLTKEEYNAVKASEVTFRGQKAWPVVVDYSPGYVPMSYDDSDKMWLTQVLSKFYDTASDYRLKKQNFSQLRLKNNKIIPGRRYAIDHSFEDTFFEIPKWVTTGVSADAIGRRPSLLSRFELLRVYQVPLKNSHWEMAIERVKEPIELTENGEREERPFYPGFFVIADNDTHEILLMDVINEHDVVAMQRQLMRLFLDNDRRPQVISVEKEHYPKLEAYFGEFLKDIDIEVQVADYLPVIESIKNKLNSLPFFD